MASRNNFLAVSRLALERFLARRPEIPHGFVNFFPSTPREEGRKEFRRQRRYVIVAMFGFVITNCRA